jgi:hypothetical protein
MNGEKKQIKNLTWHGDAHGEYWQAELLNLSGAPLGCISSYYNREGILSRRMRGDQEVEIAEKYEIVG